MSRDEMNFNTSVPYSLYTICHSWSWWILDQKTLNVSALCQIFLCATLKDLNDNILQSSSNLYCAYRCRIFIHSLSYWNKPGFVLSLTNLAVHLTVVLQYEVSPATLLIPNMVSDTNTSLNVFQILQGNSFFILCSYQAEL